MPNTVSIYEPRTMMGVIRKMPPAHTFFRSTFLSRDGKAITLRLFYRSQAVHLKNVQQPRVWGRGIPIKIAR